jgi:hypothetical protein
MCEGGAIGPFRASLHVGKLESQGCDTACRQPIGNRRHEGVGHPGTGAVCQDEARKCLPRLLYQAGDDLRLIDLDRNRTDGHQRREETF